LTRLADGEATVADRPDGDAVRAGANGADAPPEDPPRPRPRRNEVTLPAGSPVGPSETASFPFERTMTIRDFVAMLATYSRVITAIPEDRAAGLARAVLEERFPGANEVDVPLRSWCWRADRADRPDRAD